MLEPLALRGTNEQWRKLERIVEVARDVWKGKV
jgi:hypothetical protein